MRNNMNLLTNYIKTNQDKKTVGILKILLNHFVRKTVNGGSFAQIKSSPRKVKYSTNSRERVFVDIWETPEITGINEDSLKEKSVSASLRNKFGPK